LSIWTDALTSDGPKIGLQVSYRRAHALVARDMAGVNIKRVHRLWRHERFSVPCRRTRRQRANSKVLRLIEAMRPNHVWTYDVVHDACANGQRLKMLTVTDACTRESLAIEVATTMRACGVIQVLARFVAQSRRTGVSAERQWSRVCGAGGATLVTRTGGADRLQCTGQPMAKSVR
jgi:hypothetical protein